MLNLVRHKTFAVLPAIAVLFLAGAGFSQGMDTRILRKALTKALGEKSNFGVERLVTLREELKEDEKRTLIVGVIANNSPTAAGVRHGIYTDVVKIMRVLKDWGWPDKVEQVMIGEYLPKSSGPNAEARPVMTCAISSAKIRSLDWNSFDPREVPNVVDAIKLEDPIR